MMKDPQGVQEIQNYLIESKAIRARCKAIAFAIACLANYRKDLKTAKTGDIWKDDAYHEIMMTLFESHEITPDIRAYVTQLVRAGVTTE